MRKQYLQFDDPQCRLLASLIGDLEQVLKAITPDWRARRLNLESLLAIHWKRFSEFPALIQARKVRNKIVHRDSDISDDDVVAALTATRSALREVLDVGELPATLRGRVLQSLADANQASIDVPSPSQASATPVERQRMSVREAGRSVRLGRSNRPSESTMSPSRRSVVLGPNQNQ